MTDEAVVQEVTQDHFSAAIGRVSPGTVRALSDAREREEHDCARTTLDLMLRRRAVAEERDTFLCSGMLQDKCRDFPSQFRLSRMPLYELGPITIDIDGSGNSVYKRLDRTARERLPAIMAQLAWRHEQAAGEA